MTITLELLARLGELQALGRPVLLGASRKGFIGKVLLGHKKGDSVEVRTPKGQVQYKILEVK